MALLAKNSGMVSTWPMPMKRSRVFTRQAMISENVEKTAAPSMTAASDAERGQRVPVDAARRAASARSVEMTAWDSARTPADSALPSTSAARGVGLARSLWTMPRSRSQMMAMP